MAVSDAFRKPLLPFVNDILEFCKMGEITLRGYQCEVAQAITKSVIFARGFTFVIMFPRQSGKNGLQAQLEAFFLSRYRYAGGELVKISPTWKPQSQNAQRRLERVLASHPLTAKQWQKEQGYIYRVGNARQIFLSGAPEANIVGATASLLLQVDEAQDVSIDKFDKEIAPMAASTNATRVFWGTAWSDDTLLARELQAARDAENRDGVRRAFVLDAAQVAAEVPVYGKFVAQQIERLGRDHPMVRTQYFSEMLENGGGLFHEGRIALMQGEHALEHSPRKNTAYALLLDVAGEDGGLTSANLLSNPNRDFSALTIVRIEHNVSAPVGIHFSTYRVVMRKSWQGIPQSRLFEEVFALARLWQVRKVVVDATGVGAGLANFLERALPGRVLPFVFTVSSKSSLGWNFLALIDSGRFKDHCENTPEKQQFQSEARACKYAVSNGPEKRIQWSVPPGSRDSSGHPIHDDWLMSAALCAALEDEPLVTSHLTQIIHARDPLAEMDYLARSSSSSGALHLRSTLQGINASQAGSS
ncbi:MAG: hypothetical protein CVU46_11280 [Chloroflexi bacterium HGW-Chloroflexi-8]|nr:MAG: hypothetical protein CVU46_11280 [Chloroflexi bacterium HGW-Chloroflexi-8]